MHKPFFRDAVMPADRLQHLLIRGPGNDTLEAAMPRPLPQQDGREEAVSVTQRVQKCGHGGHRFGRLIDPAYEVSIRQSALVSLR